MDNVWVLVETTDTFQFEFLLRNPTNDLLVNLAADILKAAFMAAKVFITLTVSHSQGTIGSCLCKFLTDGIIAWVGGVSSVINLVVIAFEWFYAIVYPSGDKGISSKII